MKNFRKLIIAVVAALAIVISQLLLMAALPLYGAIPKSINLLVVFWTVYFFIHGVRWIIFMDRRWIVVAVSFVLTLLARIPSTYNQIAVCETVPEDFLVCLDHSSKIAAISDGMLAVVVTVATITIVLVARGKVFARP